MKTDIILEARNLRKEFKGFIAVKDVNLQVRRGSIHALIGPNGAGKTTVFNLLTKFLIPSSGQILFNGTDITRVKPADIARRGLVRSFQISAVFPPPELPGERPGGASEAPARRQLRLLAFGDDAAEPGWRSRQAAGVGQSGGLPRHRGGGAALWPQAGAGD